MRIHPILIAALSSVLFVAPACSDREPTTTTVDAKGKVYTYEQREDFRRDMETALAKLEVRVDELQAKAASATADAKQGIQKLIDDAKKGTAELRSKLAEVGSSTKEGWNDFTRKFDETMSDLGRRIEDALD